MELKSYQRRALDAFDVWLEALSATSPAAPVAAWQRLQDAGVRPAAAGDHVSRTDGAGRPIPHICFKVPTGGGKTLLAAAALRNLDRPRGLTLWLTPTRSIYDQTRRALRLRSHPCRQMLEQAGGGRVKILEKEDLFTADDIRDYLCVMLLTLPAANRHRNREFLRMFRASGRCRGLFPGR